MAKYPYDVFISYSRSDREIADAICRELKSKGLKYWMDTKIPGGENFDDEIIDALEKSKIVILIFSKNSNASPHVTTEIHNAFEMRKPIIVYRIDEIEPEGKMQYYLANKNWLDSFPDYKTNLETLITDAKRLSGSVGGSGSKYRVAIVIAVALILIAVVSLMAFSGNNTIDTSTTNSSSNDIVIDYISMEDDSANGYSWKYSYFVYGSVPSQLSNSSKDVVHVDFYDDSGKVIHSNDTKVGDIEDTTLGYAYLEDNNVAKVAVELRDSNGNVISSAESTDIK